MLLKKEISIDYGSKTVSLNRLSSKQLQQKYDYQVTSIDECFLKAEKNFYLRGGLSIEMAVSVSKSPGSEKKSLVKFIFTVNLLRKLLTLFGFVAPVLLNVLLYCFNYYSGLFKNNGLVFLLIWTAALFIFSIISIVDFNIKKNYYFDVFKNNLILY